MLSAQLNKMSSNYLGGGGQGLKRVLLLISSLKCFQKEPFILPILLFTALLLLIN